MALLAVRDGEGEGALGEGVATHVEPPEGAQLLQGCWQLRQGVLGDRELDEVGERVQPGRGHPHAAVGHSGVGDER